MKRYFVFFLFFLSCISCFAQEDIWNPTPQLPNNYIGPNKLKNIYLSAGPTTEPTFIDHGSNVITVNACCISLFDNAEHRGLPKQYDFGPATFTLNVDDTNYIVGNYNNGNPILQHITDVDLINESNIVPILTIYDKNGFLHSLKWDTIGKGLANKLHQRFVKTDRYRRESGLIMTMSNPGTNLNFTISEGRVWYGATRELIPAINSTTDTILIVYPNGTTSAITSLNNMNYYSGSLQTLTNNRYAVNWVYRGIEQQKHVYIMLGSGDYSLIEAQTAVAPAAPSLITSHAQLIAKVIVQKASNTITSLQSAYDVTFNLAAPVVHNELSGLNDGDSYEHLTAIEKSQALVGSSSVDWAGKVVTVFDSIKNSTGTAAAPAYSFASDPDTGMYSAGADSIGFSINGSAAFAANTSGFGVGVPPASILKPFAVQKGNYNIEFQPDAAGVAQIEAYSRGLSQYYPLNINAGRIELHTGESATERMRITSGGNVLIGTSTDAGAYLLQNNGYLWSRGYDLPRDTRIGWFSKDDTFTLNGVSTAQNGLTYGSTIGDHVTLTGYYGLNFATKSLEHMRITSAGNVLIATSTDDTINKLQVNGGVSIKAPYVLAQNNTTFIVNDNVSSTATFTSEVYDDKNNFDPATGVFTAPQNGLYELWAKVTWDNVVSTGPRITGFERNGDQTFMPQQSYAQFGTNGYPQLNVCGTVYLSASDKVVLKNYQGSGGDLSIIGAANPMVLSITYVRDR